MSEKSYVLTQGGSGHAPHVLTNPNDPNDKLVLCACGGTKNPQGYCDGTHKSKKPLGCPCWFCRPQENRVGKDVDLASRCG